MPIARQYVVRVDENGDGYRETSRTVREDELAVFTVDPSALDPSQPLVLAGQIGHGSPVRRSGYIGDKLYSIANDSVKVVDVSAPGTVIAELIVDPGDVVPPPEEGPLTIGEIGSDQTRTVFPATQPEGPLAAAIERARNDLAGYLGIAGGAPMLVTAQAAPEAPSAGYHNVFRVEDQHYLYRAGDSGHVQLVDGDYEFAAATGAWHAVEAAVVSPPTELRGDYNLDGRVDQQDHGAWRSSFGAWSLTEYLPADGNLDGNVDTADYVVWRANKGAAAGAADQSTLNADSAASFVQPDPAALNSLAVAFPRPSYRARARDRFLPIEVLHDEALAAANTSHLLALELSTAEFEEATVGSLPVAKTTARQHTKLDSLDRAFESITREGTVLPLF
jgi:hypothetical protein